MSRVRVPHTLVLLFAMIVLAQLATYVLPHGAFERADDGHGHEHVVPGTYAAIDDPDHLPLYAAFTAIPRGFAEAKDIIFFLFIVGGAFGVLRATRATDALIATVLAGLGRWPGLLIAGGMATFAFGSSTIGMAEEYIPFVPVLLALAIGLRFDAVTAVGIVCVGYAVGYGSAAFNPFTVLIAQEISGLPPTSGWGFRLALTVPFLLIGYLHVRRYARRVHDDPSSSLVADVEPDPAWTPDTDIRMNARHVLVLLLILAAIAFIVVGIKLWGFYLVEMGAIFLGLSVAFALVARLGPDDAAGAFAHGAADLTTTALLIGFARSIEVVLVDGQVIDTIIHGISRPLETLGAPLAAVAMYVVQSACNFFVPSGSGQAYVTMPIIAPLADLVGVERQVAVLAYQFGDGFTNILVPTNAVLIGILGMARIPYDRWLRFILPFMVQMWIAGSVILLLAVWLGWS